MGGLPDSQIRILFRVQAGDGCDNGRVEPGYTCDYKGRPGTLESAKTPAMVTSCKKSIAHASWSQLIVSMFSFA